jgi:FAD/FMN-containing dehydrogenase
LNGLSGAPDTRFFFNPINLQSYVLMRRYESWGKYPKLKPAEIISIFWRNHPPCFDAFSQPVLAYAQGRSYGDVCLNEDAILIDTTPLSRFIVFDEENGLLRCEAGVTLAEILELIVPRGWFLPVTPGTKYVSIGGAIANDIHGKNHHQAGTFGCHVRQFELLRSNGERPVCSPAQNVELYKATIGGLGLTGLILWAEIQLKPIFSPFISMERIRFTSLEEFFELALCSDRDYEYTVAWLDCLARKLGRGIFIRGNHVDGNETGRFGRRRPPNIRVPFDLPAWVPNQWTIKAFNTIYNCNQFHRELKKIVHYEPFFCPLDGVREWNRIYGKRGFLQYQFVVPSENNGKAARAILTHLARSGQAPFLVVMKKFGAVSSPGMLSFPRPGVTMALDFSHRGQETLRLLDELDEIVRDARGAVYPAKDARMSAPSFQAFFPQWREFSRFVDPKFSSSFWRRVSISRS